MFYIACPHCAKLLQVDETHAGLVGQCAGCQGSFVVPQVPRPQAPPSRPPPLPAAFEYPTLTAIEFVEQDVIDTRHVQVISEPPTSPPPDLYEPRLQSEDPHAAIPVEGVELRIEATPPPLPPIAEAAPLPAPRPVLQAIPVEEPALQLSDAPPVLPDGPVVIAPALRAQGLPDAPRVDRAAMSWGAPAAPLTVPGMTDVPLLDVGEPEVPPPVRGLVPVDFRPSEQGELLPVAPPAEVLPPEVPRPRRRRARVKEDRPPIIPGIPDWQSALVASAVGWVVLTTVGLFQNAAAWVELSFGLTLASVSFGWLSAHPEGKPRHSMLASVGAIAGSVMFFTGLLLLIFRW